MPDNLEWKGQQCPIPLSQYPKIIMAHGSGGKLTRDLIHRMFEPILKNQYLDQGHDGAVLENPDARIVMTTDSHVIQPLFFPGSDIGKLSVFGTVNDLAMCGATPRWLSLSLIMEEGLEMETLWKVIQSIGEAAKESNIQIVTGDTKVIDRKGDGELLINTTGVGTLDHTQSVGPSEIRPGDKIILSGDIGRHGIAVLSSREGLSFETEIMSDCAPLHRIVLQLLENDIPIHCMRDCTRGGMATALVELADQSQTHFELREDVVPVNETVQGACELFGLDPFYVANEGRFVLFVPESSADKALELIHSHSEGKEAIVIGSVKEKPKGSVTAANAYGGRRILDLLTGDQLPRIC
ncbi:hydrogenase expression/formation protein HypE [candidate division KSB1 bacterium]|nr:hydrogenase expression/formation protein HypE [candidate division KSB1 bacterium]